MNKQVLLDNLRSIPDFPKKGINFRDVTTLYQNAECVKIMLDELEALYKDKGITKIVGIESRGFIMASALAGRLGCGIVLARKPGKLPSTVIKESFSKEYGVDTIEMHIDSIDENDVVLIQEERRKLPTSWCSTSNPRRSTSISSLRLKMKDFMVVTFLRELNSQPSLLFNHLTGSLFPSLA